MDNEPKTFSLVPQTEDEMNDLAERGIDWIKAKLLDAEAHIPVVAQTKAVALETDTTDADDYYALLAYRSLVEFGRLLEHVQGLAAEQATKPQIIVPN